MSRIELGKIGVWTSYRPFGIERAGEAATLIEQLGYGSWWIGASPHVPDVRPVLEATSTLVAATGILNVWANEPAATAAAAASRARGLPGRFMLGIGIGHPKRPPTTASRSQRCGPSSTASTQPTHRRRARSAASPHSARRCSSWHRERAAGTHTYFVPVEHTRAARERLGPGKLVAAELACVVNSDPSVRGPSPGTTRSST
jgi:probable F420-dependent oxidoreductase